MNSKTARRASACVLNRHRSSISHSRVAKKLSHMALSYASPTEPIEGRTPASRQRRPNSIEAYCLHSSGPRNTIFVGLSVDTVNRPHKVAVFGVVAQPGKDSAVLGFVQDEPALR